MKKLYKGYKVTWEITDNHVELAEMTGGTIGDCESLKPVFSNVLGEYGSDDSIACVM